MIFYDTRKGSTIHPRTNSSRGSVTEDDAYQKSGDDMPSMVMKAGEVICIASGIYEGYDKTGHLSSPRTSISKHSSTRLGLP